MNTSGSHLGERVSALADEELDHQGRHRALGHVACCDLCRAELDAERAVRQLLRGLGDPQPAPDLLARLIAVGAPQPAAPDAPPPQPRSPGRSATGGPPSRRDAAGPARRRRSRRLAFRRARVAATGVLGVAAVVLGAVAALGGEPAGHTVPPSVPTASFTGATLTGSGGVSAVTASFLTPVPGPEVVPAPLWTAPAVARAVPMMAHSTRP